MKGPGSTGEPSQLEQRIPTSLSIGQTIMEERANQTSRLGWLDIARMHFQGKWERLLELDTEGRH